MRPTRIALFFACAASAGAMAQSPNPLSKVDDDGTLHLPNGKAVPYSDLASPEARQNFIDDIRGFEALAKFQNVADRPATWKRKPGETEVQEMRRWLDETAMTPWLQDLRQTFAVDIKPEVIGGVQTDIVTPVEGIAVGNQHRVLINLHGGGFMAAARFGGQLESVPIASVGRIKVVTVDYRMGPEHKFPAASEDISNVYRKLLETYRPENIGIYGCSAGGMLTAQSIAWLQKQDLPKPGAVGIFGAGALIAMRGDSNYFANTLSGRRPEPHDPKSFLAYFNDPDLDMDSAEVSPAFHPTILAQFPPVLLVSGTRDMGLSPAAFTHARLLEAGIDASLYVIEGAQHCSFAQPFVDPRVPENRQAWKVITRFFDRHLGTKPR